MFHRIKVMFFVVLCLPFLAACGSGQPSDKDAFSALEAMFESELDKIPEHHKSLIEIPELQSVSVLECQKANEKPGYSCDVEVTLSSKGKEIKDTKNLRFLETDTGWSVFED